ncbi:MAG TPA: hypothetical protein VEP93_08955, partial [Variovorax sp.]|nr:hypothetical protein [Variovorax sp.]
MDKESKSGGPSPSGIVAILMLTAGVLFIREVPLETTRLPVNEPRIQSIEQDVDARLWQDPFGAVARARKEAHERDPKEAKESDRKHNAQSVQASIVKRMRESGRTVEIFAVTLPGGPYSDNVETRRRVRYAVLAGLNASRLVPVDGEHLGYFFPAGVDNKDDRRLPEIVPFEWFEPAPDSRFAMSDQASIPLVLLLWLNGDSLSDQPLAKLRLLVAKFEAQRLSWRVIGPGGSDGLRDMVSELERQDIQQSVSQDYKKMRLRFYSPAATAPDERIFGKPRSTSLSNFLAQYNVQLVRTIGDDSALADALIAELKLRGLRAGTRDDPQACDTKNPGNGAKLSHIGVISEWDTLYGRTLRREFRASPEAEGFCVHRSNYVRGLDGALPAGSGDAAAAKSSPSKSASSPKEEGRRNDGTFVEVSEGQGQFDYLRRLALRMAELDQEIRRTSPDGVGLAAIGVLGSDVHDKLVVLQALQPALPNAIFFTTDLDQRFLHPRETAWARNLIVGSNFGLRLSDRFQAGLPPFRDGYQTSTFLATILAVDDTRRALRSEVNSTPNDPLDAPTSQKTILRWFDKPRIFEIGRTQAFDFVPGPAIARPQEEEGPTGGAALAAIPVSAARAAEPMSQPRRVRCEGPDWTTCGDIHPAHSPAYPQLSLAALMLILTLLIVSLWLPPILLSRAVRGRLKVHLFDDGTVVLRAWRWVRLAVLLAVVHLALPLWLASRWEPFAQWLTQGGKPLVGLEGISIWPTEALRLITLILCVYLIYAGWTALSQNLDDIIVRFRLGRTRRELVAEQVAVERHLPYWQRIANMFSLRFIRPAGMASKTGLAPDSIDFWRRYIVQNRISARATRTIACVLVALAVSWFLEAALHDVRFIPQRGHLSLVVHEWLHMLMFVAIYFLVFFVVDATTFCVGFVRGLRAHGANWPTSTLVKFEQDLHIPRSYLDNWIDLEFIAWRTKCVTRLIYFPFIVLSLFLVSRSAAFDDWYMPAVGLVLAVLGATVALACAVVLRYSAEASRRFAMDRLRDEITRLSGDGVNPRFGPH